MLFKDYNFKEDTLRFIELNGFTEPKPIQKLCIKEVMKNKDVIGISHTGTGKTHAFLIPIMEKLDTNLNEVQAVITAPTRELAMQIYNFSKLMSKANENIRVKLITGGIDRDKMADSIKKQPHIVIGTPGRIKDLFLDQKVLRIDTAKIFVVDEADMTLEYGFLEDIDLCISRMGKKVQMLCFSATIPQALKVFFKKYMNNPQTVKVDDKVDNMPNIKHNLINCKHREYHDVMLDVLKLFDPYVCLIFANTRDEASKAAQTLRDNDYPVVELHGGLEPRKRAQALKQIQNLDCKYIVATDIASRGIDIEACSHIISLGFPTEREFYIHRAGRTGRNNRDGVCYALYKASDDKIIRELIKDGIDFNHYALSNGTLKKLNPYSYVRTSKNDLREKEIAKTLTRKNEKVKPGYKKKKAKEVQRIKQKEHRAMIKASIKERRKQRYIENARKMRELD